MTILGITVHVDEYQAVIYAAAALTILPFVGLAIVRWDRPTRIKKE